MMMCISEVKTICARSSKLAVRRVLGCTKQENGRLALGSAQEDGVTGLRTSTGGLQKKRVGRMSNDANFRTSPALSRKGDPLGAGWGAADVCERLLYF